MLEEIRKIYVEDENWDGEDDNGNALALARILLSHEEIQEIKRLAKLVKDNGLYCVKRFDYTPEYYTDYEGFDWDGYKGEVTVEWEGRVETVCLKVTSDYFSWDGVLKHTNIRWTCDCIKIEDLP